MKKALSAVKALVVASLILALGAGCAVQTEPETDVPDLVTAFKAKYPTHTISGIKHAMFENEQVYAIDYTDAAGKADVAYYRPSGTWVEMETVSPAPAG